MALARYCCRRRNDIDTCRDSLNAPSNDILALRLPYRYRFEHRELPKNALDDDDNLLPYRNLDGAACLEHTNTLNDDNRTYDGNNRYVLGV